MKLPYLEYKHVPPIEVELIVIANLIIIPSDITVMAYDSFKYKIMQVSILYLLYVLNINIIYYCNIIIFCIIYIYIIYIL